MGNHNDIDALNPDDMPAPDAEKEPMLLLDTTGSMSEGTSAEDSTPRKDTIREAIGLIVSALAKHDSQASNEDDGGGLLTVTFAGGKARNLDDLNPQNLKKKWGSIHWGGGTYIMPGWRKLLHVYKEEFGKRPKEKRPVLMALVITDGEATDGEEFGKALNNLHGAVFVTVAIIGFGEAHDACLRSYNSIAQSNAHVRVVSLDSVTDPQKIADSLIKMIM